MTFIAESINNCRYFHRNGVVLQRFSSEKEPCVKLKKLRWHLQALITPILTDDLYLSTSIDKYIIYIYFFFPLKIMNQHHISMHFFHLVLTISPVLFWTCYIYFNRTVFTRCFLKHFRPGKLRWEHIRWWNSTLAYVYIFLEKCRLFKYNKYIIFIYINNLSI